jgi:hypothetical protein
VRFLLLWLHCTRGWNPLLQLCAIPACLVLLVLLVLASFSLLLRVALAQASCVHS